MTKKATEAGDPGVEERRWEFLGGLPFGAVDFISFYFFKKATYLFQTREKTST